MVTQEGREGLNTVRDAKVCMEVGLDIGENEHGAIGTSTSWFPLVLKGLRESDGVVCNIINVGECVSVETGIDLTETKTEDFMNVFATLVVKPAFIS